jgi:hypothetical protein
MRFMPGPNGTLIAPSRGVPPVPPEGYKRSSSNEWVFEPILPYCESRELRKKYARGCNACGSNPLQIFCLKDNSFVIPQICKKCPHATIPDNIS